MDSVGVNGRTVVHKGSKGFSIGPNDVCFTPSGIVGMDAVPYVNQGLSVDAINEAFTVFAEGHRVMNASSCFGMTSGDEPGTIGGVISRTFMGMASFANFSFDVVIEGLPVPRAFDPMLHNHGSPANTFGPAEIQAVLKLSGWEIVCIALCFCNMMDLKMVCFRITLAKLTIADGPYGPGPAWDPYIPGVWIEVPYYDGNPPGVYYSDQKSQYHTDENGNPLPLPAPEYPPPPGSSRPDVVITKDPRKPPEPGNIAEVYEVKFPGDGFGHGNTQLKRYQRVTGVVPKPVTPEACGCPKKKDEEEEEDEEEKDDGKGKQGPLPEPVPYPKAAPKEYPKAEPKQLPQGKPVSPLDPPWKDPIPTPPPEIAIPLLILLAIAMGAVPVPAL